MALSLRLAVCCFQPRVLFAQKGGEAPALFHRNNRVTASVADIYGHVPVSVRGRPVWIVSHAPALAFGAIETNHEIVPRHVQLVKIPRKSGARGEKARILEAHQGHTPTSGGKSQQKISPSRHEKAVIFPHMGQEYLPYPPAAGREGPFHPVTGLGKILRFITGDIHFRKHTAVSVAVCQFQQISFPVPAGSGVLPSRENKDISRYLPLCGHIYINVDHGH
jgi:hypothetical protein